MSGRMVNPPETTSYKPNFHSNLNEEHTPINFPDVSVPWRRHHHLSCRKSRSSLFGSIQQQHANRSKQISHHGRISRCESLETTAWICWQLCLFQPFSVHNWKGKRDLKRERVKREILTSLIKDQPKVWMNMNDFNYVERVDQQIRLMEIKSICMLNWRGEKTLPKRSWKGLPKNWRFESELLRKKQIKNSWIIMHQERNPTFVNQLLIQIQSDQTSTFLVSPRTMSCLAAILDHHTTHGILWVLQETILNEYLHEKDKVPQSSTNKSKNLASFSQELRFGCYRGDKRVKWKENHLFTISKMEVVCWIMLVELIATVVWLISEILWFCCFYRISKLESQFQDWSMFEISRSSSQYRVDPRSWDQLNGQSNDFAVDSRERFPCDDCVSLEMFFNTKSRRWSMCHVIDEGGLSVGSLQVTTQDCDCLKRVFMQDIAIVVDRCNGTKKLR